MAQVHIHEIVGTMRLVDGESLLSGQILERIVEAVLAAVEADRRDDASRRRDTRIGRSADRPSEDDLR